MRGEIDEQLVKLGNWLSLWNIQDISRIYPSQGTQATLTQETKKVWTLQPKPSQARGAAWGAAQARCSSAALPSDYITRPVALVQHCSSTEEQQAAAAAGRLRSISLVCVLHNTITLHLTVIQLTVKILSESCQVKSRQNQSFSSRVQTDSSSSQSFLGFYHGSPSWYWQGSCYGLDQWLGTKWLL